MKYTVTYFYRDAFDEFEYDSPYFPPIRCLVNFYGTLYPQAVSSCCPECGGEIQNNEDE
ncbi:Uncharacterized protein dnm_018950 [Desulfonema magnum]|uniref:Uncharacterized protein n=2 Tax=Desulfonema magnum TaxID=45655 RepID=A0A975BHL1_9BACT|nr:Uncharacterized protein dnm_018950 [Desulfonema magnum]